MASAFATVLGALQAALLAAPAVAGGRVYVGRDNTTPLNVASDVNLTLEGEGGEPFALTGGPVNWDVTLGIDIRARGAAGVDAVAAIDPLVESVYARVTAIDWPAGVMGAGTVRSRMQAQEAATPYAQWQIALQLSLRTQPGSLALSA